MMVAFSPFHQGELKVQKLAKESDIAQRNAGVISNKILPGAISFIGQQNILVISSIDIQGKVWVSLLIGNPGFITAPNNTSLQLDSRNIINNCDDPLWQNIKINPKVGILVIELSTRRRFRVNGSIQAINKRLFSIKVEQAYPNCPRFIQRRRLGFSKDVIEHCVPLISKGSDLSTEHFNIIQKADLFFVGSGCFIEKATGATHPHNKFDQFCCDASHRGGSPGFVEIIDKKRILIPDYKGNSLFNTLGNIHAYPKAGLIFIDFEQAKLLQITGNATILWEHSDSENKTGGTQRFWELEVTAWQQTMLSTELSWTFFDRNHQNSEERN